MKYKTMTPQPTDLVYIHVPVSEPPKEDGWYDLIDPLGEAQTFYFMEGEWYESEDDARQNENHDEVNVDGLLWLRSVPLSSLTNERIKELEASLIKALTVVRHSRNVEYSVTVPEIRSEGVKAEMAIEEILGTKEYARICEIAFNTK